MAPSDKPDPGFNQLHLYVCMMIELKDYALTDKTKLVFELCKSKLATTVNDVFPTARNVIEQYINVIDPDKMPKHLTKTNYTDEYVYDVNSLLTEIFLEDLPENIESNFHRLTNLIG